MSKLKRLLIVAGRYRAENPYLELCVKKQFEACGVEVVFALPGRGINQAGFLDSMRNDPIFHQEKAVWLNGDWDFRTHMRHCDAVLFSSWKGYTQLADLARAEGRLTFDFSALVGLDHIPIGHDHCLVKSPMAKRFLLAGHRLFGWRDIPPERITVTGSILYEESAAAFVKEELCDRESFCRHYGLDPRLPIAVLFPKSVLGFHKKIRLWFPDWPQKRVDSYNQWFLDKYQEIANQTRQAGWNLLLKMHPSSYASYWCRAGEEHEYWQQYPAIKVVVPEHTNAMLRHMDAGLGINTHSSMDTGYFRKPFIYLDSDQVEMPLVIDLSRENHFCTLPPGPSSHWQQAPSTTVNPWVPSWLGLFGRTRELPDLLADPTLLTIDETDWQRFIAEFWFKNDNKTVERIVDFVMDYCDQELAIGKRWRSVRYWRGCAVDVYHRFGHS